MSRRNRAFTVLEVLIVVTITGIILAIAVPTFFRARERARLRSCQENLHKLDGAKNEWALETGADSAAEPTWEELIGPTGYIRRAVACPGGGEYTLGNMRTTPSCSLSNQNPYPHTYEIDPN